MTHDPLVKTCINQLQKEIKGNLRIESQASWEKFCNDISLETNYTESWHKIKTFSNQRVSAIIRHCAWMQKAPRLMQIRHNFLPNLLKDTLAFRVTHFDEVNQFIEDNYEYFYPPEDPNDYKTKHK